MKSARRAAIAVIGVIALMTGGACGDNRGNSGVEVFSWWSEDGEKAGLDGLVTTFEKTCPSGKFVNGVVAGGAGTNAKQMLASRLQTGDPPDTFQAHAGSELAEYVGAGQLESLSGLYRSWGLSTAFPQGLIDNLTVQGNIFAVPANVHRTNVVWANRKVLDSAGVTTDPRTLDEFFAALDALRSRGVAAPLAMGRDWTQAMLLEAVLITDLGPDRFTKLFSGGTDWSGPDITKSINDYKRLLNYTNTDRDSLDWVEAANLVSSGRAGFLVMGDWMAGSLTARNVAEFRHFAFPGNGTVFQWTSDAFTLPTDAKNPGGARCWLKTVGSPAGQKAFNTKKGSIPARLDANPSDYPAYQQSAMADWKTGTRVPSCTHGTVCSQGLQTAINSAVGRFSSDANPGALQTALAAAAKQYIVTR